MERTLAVAQLRAARAVNNVLVETYRQIGREIVARQDEQCLSARVIERLSAGPRTAHPNADIFKDRTSSTSSLPTRSANARSDR
jgi:hypothetical protein